MERPEEIIDELMDELEEAVNDDQRFLLRDKAVNALNGLKGQRPEHIRCIRKPGADTMCGAPSNELMFDGPESAHAARLAEDRLLVCPECAFEVYKTLLSS